MENFLIEFFSWSKQFYKKQGFPKVWSEQMIKAHYSYAIPIDAINYGKIRPAQEEDLHKVQILDENNFIVAINKNEKLHSHPLNYSESDNVLSVLLAKGRTDLININSNQYDRSLLYRLDYETSGLLLLAKNFETYQFIRNNFSTVMQKKVYRLKCQGELKFPKGQWLHWLKTSGKSKSKMEALSLPDKRDEAQKAELSYQVLSYDKEKNVSEVEVFLKTGLRHQIRTQFSAMGHPILGDHLYNGLSADRLFLHAYQYGLILHEQEMVFKAPLPKNW